jgi:hypothetical protein
MQQQTFWALCILACNTPENKVKIAEAGGIKALVAAAIEAQGKFPRERAKTGVCGADSPRIGTKALPWPLFCALLYIVFGLA